VCFRVWLTVFPNPPSRHASEDKSSSWEEYRQVANVLDASDKPMLM